MKRLATLVLLSASSLLQMLSNVVGAALATIILGPHDRGLMVLGVTVAGLVALVCGLGTGSALRSELPAADCTEHRRRIVASYSGWSTAAATGASLAVVAICLLSASFVDPELAQPSFLLAVALAAVAQVSLVQLTDLWFADGLFKRGGIWAALTAAGGMLGLVLGAVMDRSAWSLMLFQAVGTLVVAGAQIWRLRSANLVMFQLPALQDLQILLRKGIPALGWTFGLAVALRVDRYILGAVAGVTAVGLYSLAATLSEIPRTVPAAVGQILMRDIAVGRRAGIPRLILSATLASLIAGSVIAVGGWLYIIPVFGGDFAPSRDLLLILIVAEAFFAPYAVASRGLVGAGSTKAVGAIGVIGGAVAIGAYCLAIPSWGMAGAAGACLVVYMLLSATSTTLLLSHAAGHTDLTARVTGEPQHDAKVPAGLSGNG